MEFNIDISKHKLYLLNALDPMEGREEESEKLIRKYVRHGFRFYNAIVFTSEAPIKEIRDYINEKKSGKYQYLLIDITNNLANETFAGSINKQHYPIAVEAAQILNAFKPIMPELSTEDKVDILFKKIKEQGINSLTQKEKEFLDNHSKEV